MTTNAVLPLPTSFTFRGQQQNQFTWQLTDASGNPITGATVTSTMYSNRSIQNPTGFPGTVSDVNFQNLPMPETPVLSGIYIGVISALFNPAPSTTGFVVVITALQGSTLLGAWSIPAVDLQAQKVNDLVGLDDVKAYIGIPDNNTDSDGTIQFIISSFSQYVLNATGRDSFNSIETYTETYDGNGHIRMFLNNSPIISIVSLQIGSYFPPQSAGVQNPGIYIEQSQKSIAFRASGSSLFPPLSIYPYRFLPGTGNIQVIYTAGYNSVPFDLGEVVMETVAQNYARKAWIDIASKSLSAGNGATGTTRYRDWALTPMTRKVLDNYSRYARP